MCLSGTGRDLINGPEPLCVGLEAQTWGTSGLRSRATHVQLAPPSSDDGVLHPLAAADPELGSD